jgi:MYXO-CTERM domain-containing protein
MFAPQSLATPVVWSVASGGNGHAYEFVSLAYTVSWEEANSAAEATALDNGDVGYLATLSSAEEQAFIQSAVLPSGGVNKNQVWIGGKQDEEGEIAAPADGWNWIVNIDVAPESWSYTNWLSEHEPSNDGEIDERFLTMWVHYYQSGQDLRGKWNDEKSVSPSTARIMGMIVEFSPPSVPEPASASLAALGVALIALLRRRC